MSALFGILLLALGFGTPALAATPPLEFGLFPNLTPRVLLETYRPLADFLAARIGRPVALSTAPDFRTFAANTARGDYDLLVTAPHLAWLAQRDAGYRPILRYREPVRGLLVVRSDSPIASPAELAGRQVATADPLAIVVMAMQARLAGVDARFVNAQTHNNAALRVFNRDADAAILGEQPFRQLPDAVRKGLRVIDTTPPLSSQMVLVHPRVAPGEAVAIRRALAEWAETPDGRTFMARGGFGGFAPIAGDDVRAFRPYAAELARRLGGTQ
jgi:phosphonate transport system substrate-binding protein